MFPAPQAKAPHQQPTSSRHLLRHALLLRAIPGLEYPASGPMCRRVETRLNIRKQSDHAALKRGTTTFACRIRQLRNRSSVHQPAGFVRRIGDSAYVRHQGGYSADLFKAGPPWLMMATRSASLILLSVSPSVKACGFTERLSMFDTRCGVDSGSWQRMQYSALSCAPTVCWYPSAISSSVSSMFFPDASRVLATSLYRPACCPSETAVVTWPLESVSAAAGVKITPDGPRK